ncbi:MAG: hypothetical protein SFU91_06195 [Chloroherpetonaceae bacterium]|nr:hypothetical protein [Chloroherpetonaceae bacterium]
MRLSQYKNIILDCDGVILDSNALKESNIKSVVKNYLDKESLNEFIDYFVGNNGITREVKIRKFFNPPTSEEVLKNYSDLNASSLMNSELTKGFHSFYENVLFHFKGTKIVLSGGAETELISVLAHKNIFRQFNEICGGPNSKYDHLDRLNLKGPTLYIGDSKLDYEVANHFNFNFLFMFGYTQVKDWKSYVTEKNITYFQDWTEFPNEC